MTRYDLLITNAQVVRPGVDQPERLDIGITDEKFAAVEPRLDLMPQSNRLVGHQPGSLHDVMLVDPELDTDAGVTPGGDAAGRSADRVHGPHVMLPS